MWMGIDQFLLKVEIQCDIAVRIRQECVLIVNLSQSTEYTTRVHTIDPVVEQRVLTRMLIA